MDIKSSIEKYFWKEADYRGYPEKPLSFIPVCLDDEIEANQIVKLEILKNQEKDIAIQILVEIYKKLNWLSPNKSQISKDIDEAFKQISVSS